MQEQLDQTKTYLSIYQKRLDTCGGSYDELSFIHVSRQCCVRLMILLLMYMFANINVTLSYRRKKFYANFLQRQLSQSLHEYYIFGCSVPPVLHHDRRKTFKSYSFCSSSIGVFCIWLLTAQQ